MAAIVARQPALPRRSATPPARLAISTTPVGTPVAVPNKHLPVCSPGPRPVPGVETPPTSPPEKETIIEAPPTHGYFDCSIQLSDNPLIYAVDAEGLVSGLEQLATRPMPDPRLVFPWLHGLHPENQLQLAFFAARRRLMRRSLKAIRGIAIVKVGGDLSCSKIKGALSPQEIISDGDNSEVSPAFLDIDPREGFSIRNFQIQACKLATVSDVVVYGQDGVPREEVIHVAKQIAQAQQIQKQKAEGLSRNAQTYNTLVLTGMTALFIIFMSLAIPILA